MSLLAQAKQIAQEIAANYADEVDQQARFPTETVQALKQARLLSAYIPPELGGAGASLSELVQICETLGRHCASSAMIFAMHQIQVITLVHHGMQQTWMRDYLKQIAAHQYLIASVTSEAGVGGEMRRSRCAVNTEGMQSQLDKDATTISYGAQADGLLVSARRHADAANNDQVLVMLHQSDYRLEQKGQWNTMGMRGTCSPPFMLSARFASEQIMTVPFGDMAAQTVVPVSHLLWGACWSGCASAAVNKARAFVRNQARSNPGTVPPTALRLAELVAQLQSMRNAVSANLHDYLNLRAASDAESGALTGIAYSLKMNNLKLDLSETLPHVVAKALMICGILGYKNDSPFAMNRHLRDAYSAPLMVGNDRILATNANLLLILKDD